MAYVLMPNHVHMLIFAEETVHLRKQLGIMKRQSAHYLINHLKVKESFYLNQMKGLDHGKEVIRFWQYGGGHDRSLKDIDRINKAIEYIHNNPVKSGIIGDALEYKWSSSRAWLKGEQEPIAINPDSYGI